jgi:hypothetical protein
MTKKPVCSHEVEEGEKGERGERREERKEKGRERRRERKEKRVIWCELQSEECIYRGHVILSTVNSSTEILSTVFGEWWVCG